MKNHIIFLLFASIIITACHPTNKIYQHGKHYQQHHDYFSLAKVVKLVEIGTDTTQIKNILGEPINMGFDYRYLIDSTGENGCTIGAVFHIDEAGKIDQKWIDEICE